MFINLKAWAALSPAYKVALEVAFAQANQWSTAKYDISNPTAMRELVAAGAPSPSR